MGDLVCVRIVFPKSLVIEFFSPTYKAIVWQVFPFKVFFVGNQYAGYFFLKSPIPQPPPPPLRQKSNGRPLSQSQRMLCESYNTKDTEIMSGECVNKNQS